MREIDPEGKMLSLEQSADGERHWSDDYDGRCGIVIHGHDPVREVKVSPHAFGIDTGCCFGGKLTALVNNLTLNL